MENTINMFFMFVSVAATAAATVGSFQQRLNTFTLQQTRSPHNQKVYVLSPVPYRILLMNLLSGETTKFTGI